ncbi:MULTISPECIES: PspC domain-containing protein [unclassified Anoxybacillus]|jgi:phage shock protein C|uniref:PspC domain-containing protein n=1 Tax=unclassified Anoxybacillus TaxID=2639704 RepID=UPI0005CDB6F4|nr:MULTISPECIES: PspC domain-containing protein [unclassified Anoxybacillus]
MNKKLVRSYHDRKIAGVLGGLAAYFRIDSTLIRLIFVILLLSTGIMPFVLFYVIAALVMPQEGMER